MSDRQQTLIPHLVVDGAAAAIEFYKKALGATEAFRMPAEDGKRLLHAELVVGGMKFFLVDHFPEHMGSDAEHSAPPTELKGTSVTIHLEVPDCDAAVNRAVEAGAQVSQRPWDAFWGARYGRVVDPFGHSWSFAHPLPQAN